MGFVLRFILGMGMVGAGVFFVIRTTTIESFFGSVAWAEAKIGPGGTRLFYKLLGIVVILIGCIVAFNLWDAFLQATLGRLFPQVG